jgi:hypothetical protein
MTTEWDQWTSSLSGGDDEDLSSVLTHVRPGRMPSTRAEWANHPRTRDFCNLGLHLLYADHVDGRGGATAGVRLFRALTPTALQAHASVMIEDAEQAEALSVDRFSSTWMNLPAYTEDLLAYLFRPKPYLRRILRRILRIRQAMAEMTAQMTFGELVRSAAAAELEETTRDPVIALQTLVQAALPADTGVRALNLRLEEQGLRLWAELYSAVFPAYGLTPRETVTWLDIAEMFSTMTEGALLRRRVRGEHPRLSNGDDMLAGLILAATSGLFDVQAADVEDLTAGAPANLQPPGFKRNPAAEQSEA